MDVAIDWLEKWAMTSPKKCAVKCLDTGLSLTYSSLYIAAKKIAQNLLDNNVSFGDRVAILSANRIEHILLFFACQRLGAILTPLNFRLSDRELSAVVSDASPQILFFDDIEFPYATDLPAKKMMSLKTILHWAQSQTESKIPFRNIPSEPSLMLYTSGTTGTPKGVLTSEDAMFWNAINTSMRLGISFETNHLCFHPFFHASGWNVLTIPTLRFGGTVFLLSKFDPEKVLEHLQQLKISILFGVPTMLDRISQIPKFQTTAFPYLRFAVVGGEPMPLDAIRIWHQKKVPIRQGFGMTEFGTNVFSLNAEDAERKLGSIGTPNFYMQVRVVNAEGQVCPPNSIGELQLRGPVAMNGYWNKPSESAAAFENGWLKTGDLVKYDDEGFFYVAGRKKEMFISGGENVFPAEVELAIREHEKVREVAVIGVKDDQWGEVGVAFVVLNEPITQNELREYCRTHLAKYKVPKEFRFVSDLPKSESGKILKKALTL